MSVSLSCRQQAHPDKTFCRSQHCEARDRTTTVPSPLLDSVPLSCSALGRTTRAARTSLGSAITRMSCRCRSRRACSRKRRCWSRKVRLPLRPFSVHRSHDSLQARPSFPTSPVTHTPPPSSAPSSISAPRNSSAPSFTTSRTTRSVNRASFVRPRGSSASIRANEPARRFSAGAGR
jgi:hypothetical protein